MKGSGKNVPYRPICLLEMSDVDESLILHDLTDKLAYRSKLEIVDG